MKLYKIHPSQLKDIGGKESIRESTKKNWSKRKSLQRLLKTF